MKKITSLQSMLRKLGMLSAVLVMSVALGADSASASTVTRSFDTLAPAAGAPLTVSLAVDVVAPDTTAPNDFYVIDEIIPAGWTISNAGTGDTSQAGHIKWAVLSGAVSTVNQYTVTVPGAASGVNTFSGEFAFGSSAAPLPILGETSVDVQAASPTPTPVLTSVDITPITAAVEVGATLQLTGTPLDQNGAVFADPTMEILWTSGDTTIADVDPVTGLVTGISEGLTNINMVASVPTATGADVALGVADITVTAPAPVPAPNPVLTSVTVAPATASIEIGATQQLTANPLDQNTAAFAGATVSFASSDTAIATVDASGLVTAVSAGSATITASATDGVTTVSGTSAVTVTAPAPAATESAVTRSFSSATPAAGDPLTVSLAIDVVAPDTTAPNDFYIIDEVLPAGWIVSNAGTGDTTQAGHIKWAVLSGAVSGVEQYTVTVPADASGVSTFSGEFAFGSNLAPLPILGATSVQVQAVQQDNQDPAVSVSSVTRSFSSVTPDAGSPLTVSLNVNVAAPDTTAPNDFYIIDEVLPAGWIVSNAGTGDISQAGHIKWAVLDGAVSGVEQYTVTVPGAASGVSTFSGEFAFGSNLAPLPILGTASVSVQGVPALTSVTVSPATASIAVGATQSLIASVLDQNSVAFVGATTTFSSSDTAIATVDASGLVTAVSAGSATITASATDGIVTVTGTSTMTINAPAPAAPEAPAPAPVVSSGGGGGGGGGGFGGGIFSGPGSFGFQTIVPTFAAQLTQPQGQVLGVAVFIFTRGLDVGARGDDVTELQKFLMAEGHLKILTPTGFFGPATRAAVKQFQKANGLEDVGSVGPKTRALLNKGKGSANQGKNLSDNQGKNLNMTAEARAVLIQQLQAQLQDLLKQLQALITARQNGVASR